MKVFFAYNVQTFPQNDLSMTESRLKSNRHETPNSEKIILLSNSVPTADRNLKVCSTLRNPDRLREKSITREKLLPSCLRPVLQERSDLLEQKHF